MSLRRAWALALLGLAGLSGCAVQTAALREQPPADLSPRVELAATPFFPQTEYQCGPAALATALGAAGIPAQPAALAEQVFLPAREGTLQAEMLSGTRRQGAVATLLPPRLEAVLREVAAGRPVVVMQNLGLSFAPLWHYAVLVGYDIPEGDAVLRSGTTQRAVMRLRTFEHTWARSGFWAFAVTPPGEWPLMAQEQAVVEAAVGFERVATPAQSLRAYETALQRWPGNLSLAMGVGNAAYAAGDLARAEQAYRNAAQQHGSGAAWVNLANLLLERGDAAQSEDAARHALDDAKWSAQAREVFDRARARLPGGPRP